MDRVHDYDRRQPRQAGMQVFKQVTDLIAGIRKDIDAQTTRLKREGEYDSPELENLNEADGFLRKSLEQLRQAQQRIQI